MNPRLFEILIRLRNGSYLEPLVLYYGECITRQTVIDDLLNRFKPSPSEWLIYDDESYGRPDHRSDAPKTLAVRISDIVDIEVRSIDEEENNSNA